MNQRRNDHYVPQFVLRRFRPNGKGKLFYAEKGAPGISRQGVARTFCELDGDLLLNGPPTIRREGAYAVLAEPPEYTVGVREHLSRLEHRWAPGIKRLVESVYRQHRPHAGKSRILRAERAPPEHAEWCAAGKDYCIRQRFRSPDVGDELWARMLEGEERELRAWIRTTLGRELEPDDEFRAIWRDHNRHKIRTGAEAEVEGLFDDVDSTFVLTTWFATDSSRFIVGSKGGVLIQASQEELWICPVDPRVALGIEGRRGNAESLGLPSGERGHFAKGYLLPRDGLTVENINRASWNQCRAVAGSRRHDVAGATENPTVQGL